MTSYRDLLLKRIDVVLEQAQEARDRLDGTKPTDLSVALLHLSVAEEEIDEAMKTIAGVSLIALDKVFQEAT